MERRLDARCESRCIIPSINRTNHAAMRGAAENGRILSAMLGGANAAEAAVLMVSFVEAAAPVGVTAVGAKLQDAPVGRPEQEKLTA